VSLSSSRVRLILVVFHFGTVIMGLNVVGQGEICLDKMICFICESFAVIFY
jgi:hypothetical protein